MTTRFVLFALSIALLMGLAQALSIGNDANTALIEESMTANDPSTRKRGSLAPTKAPTPAPTRAPGGRRRRRRTTKQRKLESASDPTDAPTQTPTYTDVVSKVSRTSRSPSRRYSRAAGWPWYHHGWSHRSDEKWKPAHQRGVRPEGCRHVGVDIQDALLRYQFPDARDCSRRALLVYDIDTKQDLAGDVADLSAALALAVVQRRVLVPR